MKLLVRRLPLVFLIAVLATALLVPPASAQGQVHVVQRGETLYAIATRYGTTVQAISRWSRERKWFLFHTSISPARRSTASTATFW